MSKVTFGNQTFDTGNLLDKQALIDKVKAAQSGEQIPGVAVFNMPKNHFTDDSKLSVDGSLTTILLVVGLAFILLRPVKR